MAAAHNVEEVKPGMASELGVPTFEASVACGTYCQGGVVRMEPTTYAEFTEASEVWVRGDVVALIHAEVVSLRRALLDCAWMALDAEDPVSRQKQDNARQLMRELEAK